MLTVHRLALAGLCLGVFLYTEEAQAQYKSSSWGVYLGAGFFLPSGDVNYYKEATLITANNGVLPAGLVLPPNMNPTQGNETAPRGNPFSLANPMLSLEYCFKISSDFTWWFKVGFTTGITFLVTDTASNAMAQGGAALWLEGIGGPRVYLATDNIRPYFEAGLRLPGLVIFNGNTKSVTPTSMQVFPGVYGNFGLEFIVATDFAIAFVARYTRFIVINGAGFNDLDGQFGFVFYN